MTPEFIAIISVGVALGVFGFAGFRFLNKQLAEGLQEVHARVDRLERQTTEQFDRVNARFDRVDDRIDRLEQQTNERFDRVDDRFERLEIRMSAIEQRQARLEGLLDGLREALFARATD